MDESARRAGVALRDLREGRGLTQDQLAERSHVSQAAISNYENGKRPISDEVLKAIAPVLRRSVKSIRDAIAAATEGVGV